MNHDSSGDQDPRVAPLVIGYQNGTGSLGPTPERTGTGENVVQGVLDDGSSCRWAIGGAVPHSRGALLEPHPESVAGSLLRPFGSSLTH